MTESIPESSTKSAEPPAIVFQPEECGVKHRHPLMPNDYRATLCVGKPRVGKSTFVPAYFDMLAESDYVFIFAKNLAQPAYQYITDKQKSLERENMLIKSNEIDLSKVYKRKDKLKEHRHNLIIFDDYNGKELAPVVSLFESGRHMNCSVLVVCHSFFKAAPELRDYATDVILFTVGGAQSRYIIPALVDDAGISLQELKTLYKRVIAGGRGCFLWICCDPCLPDYLRVRYRTKESMEDPELTDMHGIQLLESLLPDDDEL